MTTTDDDRAAERAGAVLGDRGFSPSEAEAALRLLRAVLEEGTRVNLTAARTFPAAVDAVLLSAAAVRAGWEHTRPPDRVVDVGTGNGFPGAMAAIAWPSAEVLLLERRSKKARAVAAALRTAGIPNAEVLALDARELARERPGWMGHVDLVTIRAVGRLGSIEPVTARWLAPGGRVLHWKGAGLDGAERTEGDAAAQGAGLVPLRELSFSDHAGPAHLVRYERR